MLGQLERADPWFVIYLLLQVRISPVKMNKNNMRGLITGVQNLLRHNCLSAAAAARSTDKAQ